MKKLKKFVDASRTKWRQLSMPSQRQSYRICDLFELFHLVLPTNERLTILDISYGGILMAPHEALVRRMKTFLNQDEWLIADCQIAFFNHTIPCKIKLLPPRPEGLPATFIHWDAQLLTELRKILEFIRIGQSLRPNEQGLFVGDLGLEVEAAPNFQGKPHLKQFRFPTESGTVCCSFEEDQVFFQPLRSEIDETDLLYEALALLLGIKQTGLLAHTDTQISLILGAISDKAEAHYPRSIPG